MSKSYQHITNTPTTLQKQQSVFKSSPMVQCSNGIVQSWCFCYVLFPKGENQEKKWNQMLKFQRLCIGSSHLCLSGAVVMSKNKKKAPTLCREGGSSVFFEVPGLRKVKEKWKHTCKLLKALQVHHVKTTKRVRIELASVTRKHQSFHF